MKAKIISLNSLSITPETDEEKLILASWLEEERVISPTINNAGLDHPARYVSFTITKLPKPPIVFHEDYFQLIWQEIHRGEFKPWQRQQL